MSDDFNRVALLFNPESTRKRSLRHHVASLQDEFGTARVVEYHTHPSDKDTTDMLKAGLQCGDVVVTMGGDGTARTAAEALADLEIPAHHATLLPLPGGYRNDLSHQLYSRRALRDPVRIIHDANTIDVRPMSVRLDHEWSEEYISVLYASIGAMALGAWYQSSPEYRGHWAYSNAVAREAYSLGLLPWTLRNAHVFSAEIDGRERQLLDATVANVSVLAKYLHPPVELTDDKLFYSELRSKAARHIVPYVARLMAQPHVAPPRHEMVHLGNHKTITVHEDTYLQTDGNARPLMADTTVTFSPHESTFRAFTSK